MYYKEALCVRCQEEVAGAGTAKVKPRCRPQTLHDLQVEDVEKAANELLLGC